MKHLGSRWLDLGTGAALGQRWAALMARFLRAAILFEMRWAERRVRRAGGDGPISRAAWRPGFWRGGLALAIVMSARCARFDYEKLSIVESFAEPPAAIGPGMVAHESAVDAGSTFRVGGVSDPASPSGGEGDAGGGAPDAASWPDGGSEVVDGGLDDLDDLDNFDGGSAGCDVTTYVPDVSCGVGHCRTTNTPSACVAGVETPCVPGAPLDTNDATCDGVDDNCSGAPDEDYVSAATSCGIGLCAASGLFSCQGGAEVDTCTPGTPSSIDTAASGAGIDDDCDGTADEDEPCDTTPRAFSPGSYTALAVPLNCTQMTVRLWGGAGAGGEMEGVLLRLGGRGGAGGYAESTLVLNGQALDLEVGAGAAAGCDAGGANPVAGFSGGSGGSGEGANGDDGLESGGGSGAVPGIGSPGGGGYRGGGGGGSGTPLLGFGGAGGGGGASTVLWVDGVPVALAGGGGGGGGAASMVLAVFGVPGGAGGAGCGGSGGVAHASGGGGGGGGACFGDVVQSGASHVPHDVASLPPNQAVGGVGQCGAGGGGYAIVTFGP